MRINLNDYRIQSKQMEKMGTVQNVKVPELTGKKEII
jgi:hypothetical protein